VSTQRIVLHLMSAGPLLMRSSRLADPLEPITQQLAAVTSKRMKTVADFKRIAELEWHGSLWLHKGKPCLTPEALEAAFIEGAKTRKRGRIARAAFAVEAPAILEHDGPSTLGAMWNDKDFRLRAMVRIRGDSMTVRTRPRFPRWSARVTATFLTTMLNRDEVVEYFRVAGSLGIGDWRPKYGKFVVDEVSTK
jgi:hypothetical protein